MANFKVGQKVVCVYDFGRRHFSCPSLHEICTISWINDRKQLAFVEYPASETGASSRVFSAKYFKPLEYKSVNSEILQKFPLTEEKADAEVGEQVVVRSYFGAAV